MILASLAMLLPLVTSGQPLESYVHHKRVVLVFAAQASGDLQQQLAFFAPHAAQLTECDVIVYPIQFTSPDKQAVAIRTRFHVAQDTFTVILIGKDGGEKLRQHVPLTYEQLAPIIDAMPMRQDEMRHKQ